MAWVHLHIFPDNNQTTVLRQLRDNEGSRRARPLPMMDLWAAQHHESSALERSLPPQDSLEKALHCPTARLRSQKLRTAPMILLLLHHGHGVFELMHPAAAHGRLPQYRHLSSGPRSATLGVSTAVESDPTAIENHIMKTIICHGLTHPQSCVAAMETTWHPTALCG
jgi:hypothetical protein